MITLYASLLKRAFLIFSSFVALGVIVAAGVIMYDHNETRESRKASFHREIKEALENLQHQIEHKTRFIVEGLEGVPRPEEVELLDRLSDALPVSLSYHYRFITDSSQRSAMILKDAQLIFLMPLLDTSSTSLVFSTPLSSVEKVLGTTISTTPHAKGQDEVLVIGDGQKLYFYNPMGDFFYSFSKRYHYELILIMYVSLTLITFFALGTAAAFFMGRKKAVGNLVSLIQNHAHLKDVNIQLEKEMILLKELLHYQKNRDTLRKRLRSFLEKYYNQRLSKLSDLAMILSSGVEKGSLGDDDTFIIVREIKEITTHLKEKNFEPCPKDQINITDLLEKVKSHLMPTLLRARIILSIRKMEQSLALKGDEKLLELYFYAQIKSLLAKLYQDATIDVCAHSLESSVELEIRVNGVVLGPLTQNLDENIDLGFMRLSTQQVEKLGEALKIQVKSLEGGHLRFALPIQVDNFPKREIRGNNVIKLHA
jgi:hypothetical protein